MRLLEVAWEVDLSEFVFNDSFRVHGIVRENGSRVIWGS